MSLIVSGATIIDGVKAKPIEGQEIWIEAGRIKAICKRDELDVSPQAKIVDARGKHVIPGLMDANVHLLGDIRLENLVRHEDRYEELIVEAAQVALKNGLTTVFDTWGPRAPLMAVRDRIDAGAIPGSRIFCAGNIIGLDGPISVDFIPKTLEVASGALAQRINSLWAENVGPDLTWMTPEQVAEEVRSYIGKGIDFIKYASSEHRGTEPCAFLAFSPMSQTNMIEEAHRAGITAQAHTTSVESLRVAIEAGCDLIQHANITGPVLIPETTLELLVERKTGAALFPFTQRRLDMIMKKSDAIVRRYLSTVDTNCRNVMRSGAMLLLATDACIQAAELVTDPLLKNSWLAAGEDNMAELGEGHFHWLKAMEEKGFPAMMGLKAATMNIAIAYGKDKDMGSIEPGKIADMVILDKDPLQAAENYRSIYMIIKDGSIEEREVLPAKAILTKPSPALPEAVATYGRYAVSKYPSCC
jgi:imidazolonepropionase-like amidohydrolase